MTARMNFGTEGCDGACADLRGGMVDEELGLITEGALRRVTGLTLAGEGGEGGGIEPFIRGSAPLLETDCDTARRERGMAELMLTKDGRGD